MPIGQNLPKDGANIAMQLTPAVIALAQTVNASISSSSSITFNAATTILRVYAISQDVYFKWGSTAVTSSNFDEIIPASQIVDLVVPKDSTGTKYTTCKFIERTASATIVVIEK